MKTLIIYISYHHHNTERIARVIGEVLDAEMRSPESTTPEHLMKFDPIGFGSGNYFGKFDKRLVKFIDDLPSSNGKNVFIFSTCASSKYMGAHKELRKHFNNKGFKVVAEWNCRAYDSFGLLMLLGGINKGKPDEGDVEVANKFAEGLMVQGKK